jgi:2-polyprenyl-3-methyl-5-hydroxy-6-metoxy-1,4-benzoquinol methylase
MKTRGICAMFRNRANRESVYSSAEYWDGRAEAETDETASKWPNRHLNRLYHIGTTETVSRFLPDVTGQQMLDLGCGTGGMCRHLAERGAQITGIDFSAKAIEVAKKLSAGDNPRYRVGSMFDLDDKGVYDSIVSWASITMACQNRGELLNVMTRLRNAVKPDGKILLIEPIHVGFLHRVLNMTTTEFCNVMADAGLRVYQVTEMHFWPARIALAYVSWPSFITVPLYSLGERMMSIPGLRSMGDYEAIYASPCK